MTEQTFPRCEAHGLRVDPQTGSCVLCRRTERPEAAAHSRKLAIVVALSILGMVIALLSLLALRTPASTEEGVSAAEQESAQASAEDAGESTIRWEGPGVTLFAPNSFRKIAPPKRKPGAPLVLKPLPPLVLQSMRDQAMLQVSSELRSDLPKGLRLTNYAETVRESFVEDAGATVGSVERASIGQDEAFRFALETSHDGIAMKGYCYVAEGGVRRSASTIDYVFLQFLVLAVPSNSELLEASLIPVVEQAKLRY